MSVGVTRISTGRTSCDIPTLTHKLDMLNVFGTRAHGLDLRSVTRHLNIDGSTICHVLFALADVNCLGGRGARCRLNTQMVDSNFDCLTDHSLIRMTVPRLGRLHSHASLSYRLDVHRRASDLCLCQTFTTRELSMGVPINAHVTYRYATVNHVLLASLDRVRLKRLCRLIQLSSCPTPTPHALLRLRGLVDRSQSEN